MKILPWLLLLSSAFCAPDNRTAEVTGAAKLAEEYVLAADFDNNPVAQVQAPEDLPAEAKDGNGNRSPEVYFTSPTNSGANSGSSVDRDGILPPQPQLIISERSLLAVGFLTFLILMNSLQSSMINMAIMRNPAPASTSLLGGVTQALGRRRRRRRRAIK